MFEHPSPASTALELTAKKGATLLKPATPQHTRQQSAHLFMATNDMGRKKPLDHQRTPDI
jgi:hypothetical protein